MAGRTVVSVSDRHPAVVCSLFVQGENTIGYSMDECELSIYKVQNDEAALSRDVG